MAAGLRINNFDNPNIKEIGVLTADAAANQAALVVENSQNLQASYALIVGPLGAEGSELAFIQSAAAPTGVTLSTNLKLAHKNGEAITELWGDQIQIYRAPNITGYQPADDAFVALDGGPINIDPDQLFTDYVDQSGGSAYWYKFTYKNSSSGNETDLASALAARGGGYGQYCSVDDIRSDAGFSNNRNITDAVIDSCRIDAEAEVEAELAGVYALPFTAPIPNQVNEVTKFIATGLLLLKEYGAVTSGTNKEGTAKLKNGRDLLLQYKTREKTIVDAQGVSLLLSTASVVTSWPNETTAGASEEDNGGGNLMHISHDF